ncbi:MAG: hypothetical protein ACRD3N_10135 [Terracidiphilus sp.]
MIGQFLPEKPAAPGASGEKLACIAILCAFALFAACALASAQVLTIDTGGRAHQTANGPVDVRFSQVAPTHVDLARQELDNRTRLTLIRALQSEQGFAMRPFPRGHKGLTLVANGKLEPAGEAYLDMATANGLSAKPGDRLVITNVNIDRNRIVFDLNGGPDPKHRFLRHIQIGMGDPTMGDPDMQPIVQDSGQQPTGARLTLEFKGHIPEMTAAQVEDLLKPLISFNVETPIEAFTNTLPAPLKNAILNHEVWVGMTTDMVQYAKGDPVNKYRETDGQEPIVIWMYGRAPDPVEFVRVNGNRVIRVEIARVGQPLEVFTQDRVAPLMMGAGKPEVEASNVHPNLEGDVQRNPQTQAPAPPPSLRDPGEKLPQDSPKNAQVWGPVYFPPNPPDDSTQLGQNPDTQPPAAAPASSQPKTAAGTQSKTAAGTQTAPANGSQPTPANGTGQQTAPANAQSASPSGSPSGSSTGSSNGSPTGSPQSTPAKPQPENVLASNRPN